MKHALSNRAVNFLNLHFGLQSFANNIGHIFLGIYLYERNIPLWMIFVVWMATFLLRLLIRPLSLKLVFQRGLRKSVILGTCAYSTLYLFLGKVSGVDIWLGIFIIAASIIDVLYWLPYHTYFSILGDLEHRGKQIGVREGIVHFANFLAPITGGVIINLFGFWTAFIVATVCMLFAAFSLKYTPEIPLKDTLSFGKAWKKVNKAGAYAYMSSGFLYQAHLFTWPLVLFIMLNDYVVFGGLLSLAVLFQIIGFVWMGHLFDSGNGKRIYPVALFIGSIVIIGRTFFATTIPLIILFDVLFMVAYTISLPIENSAFYNTSKKSHHPLWFQFYAENGWDVGSVLSAFLIAVFLYGGGELRYVMPLGILGLVGIGMFLRWYFVSQK